VKGSFDATERDVQQLATHLVLLDGELRSFGPEAKPARKLLSRFTEEIIAGAWPAPTAGAALGWTTRTPCRPCSWSAA
jgi:hypothetical protein